jgi:molecular chaperone GrpE
VSKKKPTKDQLKTAKLEEQVQQLNEDLKRSHADFINFKRRADEDKQRSIKFGRETAIMALLPLIDNIERALTHIPKTLEKNEWAIGVKGVAKQVEDVLRGIGVEKIVSLGAEFDPNLHDAVSVDDSTGKKEVVVEELQPGYTMDGEVIRHAMVKVGRK